MTTKQLSTYGKILKLYTVFVWTKRNKRPIRYFHDAMDCVAEIFTGFVFIIFSPIMLIANLALSVWWYTFGPLFVLFWCMYKEKKEGEDGDWRADE